MWSDTRFPDIRPAARALVVVAALVGAAAEARAQSQPLVVSTEWVAERLRDPDLVLLHVGSKSEYDAGHLPGARLISLQDIATGTGHGASGLSLELPPIESLQRTLQELGITNSSTIVVYYGDDWVSPATRVVFTLDWAGLGARTSLLDGGMRQWKREQRPLSRQAPQVRRGTLRLTPNPALVADAAVAQRAARAKGFVLIDARAPVFYSGPAHGTQRAGHIPGAKNVPFTTLVDEGLMVRDRQALAAEFAKAGVQPGDTIVAYCHIGQQATSILLAARLLGHPVKLYDGSFDEWSSRRDLPVEGGRSR